MLQMKYAGEEAFYPVSFKNITDNVVQLLGDFPIKKVGFSICKQNGKHLSNYPDHVTVYREIDGGVQFSNDGSVYVAPVPKVNFIVSGGGTLDGEATQKVKDYSELVIPTPIANTDYEFTQWSPAIPESGEVEKNRTFTAIFVSTLPQPEPEEVPSSLAERVAVIEEDMKNLNKVFKGE